MDMDDVVFELRKLQGTVVEVQLSTARIETKLENIVGGEQKPGRLDVVEVDVRDLKAARNKQLGFAAAVGSMVTAFFAGLAFVFMYLAR